MPESYRRESCRLCNSGNLQEVLKLTPTPRANEFVAADQLHEAQAIFPLELVQCGDCAHVQLHDVVDAGSMFRDYVYVSGTSPSFVNHFREYASDLVSEFDIKGGGLVVDVGSNDGTLLRAFKDIGFNVLGIDPARNIAEAATQSGIETLCDFLSTDVSKDIVERYGKCSLVTANNVFAHVDNLEEFVTSVKTLMAPDGLFVFEVSYLVDVYQKTLFDTIYHEHTDYHSVQPFIGFFKRHGMELISARRIPTHGGSIRCIVQHAEGGRSVDATVEQQYELEKELKLDSSEAFIALSKQISDAKNSLASLLEGIKSQGLSIGAYGAPAKATTLMYHFDINQDVIEFIIDDSPLKQGLYSPGMHIPVLSSSAIEDKKPDVLVILAWNFADPIIDNNRHFLEAGGKFVIPLPTVKVVE